MSYDPHKGTRDETNASSTGIVPLSTIGEQSDRKGKEEVDKDETEDVAYVVPHKQNSLSDGCQDRESRGSDKGLNL